MAGEQTTETPGEAEERLAALGLASQSEGSPAATTAPAPGEGQLAPGLPPGLTQASLQAMLKTVVNSLLL